MEVNTIILGANPFFDAYIQSDMLGKFIFIALYALSVCSWVILIHKIWLTHQVKKSALRFHEAFQLQKLNPLSLDFDNLSQKKAINPFLDLYKVLKKQSLDLLAKNRHFSQQATNISSINTNANSIHPSQNSLSLSDIDFVASHLSATVASQVKFLEKHLYILSTTVSLAPFLGLLGTVWGILMTFSALQSQSAGSTHQMVLGGLSLALATTVLGLLDAIPALIGYNYLKNSIRDFATDMEGFSNEILASVELQYRKVDN
ncbi:MAG: MotA/TolQ/ExbB proton channel family protein [Parachlamydiaceae bacterium]|nr:MotA/TolQ/ExbB proton channel family protein [Parachlamydiaceae bacterium]